MKIQDSKNVVTGNNEVNGSFHVGDNFYKSAEYKDFLEKIEDLEELVATAKTDAKRLKYSQRLNDEREKLEAFKREVIALAELFDRIALDNQRLQRAKAHFEAGEYKEARAVLDAEQLTTELDALLAKKNRITQLLRDKADEFLILARLTAINLELDNRFEQTCTYFEQSLQAQENYDNLFAYAVFLQKHNQNNKATPYYVKALDIVRELVLQDEPTYLPNVAVTLNNLGLLQVAQNEYVKAEQSYDEALEIIRALAEVNPQAYFPNVAMTLNNLANLQYTKNEYVKAEQSYGEALKIYRDLGEVNPQTFLPDVATTLNNLANLQRAKNEYVNAEQSYGEALKIKRALAAVNPQTFLPKVAMTLINISIYYLQKKQDAEQAFQYVDEAIDYLLPLQHIGYIQNYLKSAFWVLDKLGIDKEKYLQSKTNSRSNLQGSVQAYKVLHQVAGRVCRAAKCCRSLVRVFARLQTVRAIWRRCLTKLYFMHQFASIYYLASSATIC